jgi:hypothetical protein
MDAKPEDGAGWLYGHFIDRLIEVAPTKKSKRLSILADADGSPASCYRAIGRSGAAAAASQADPWKSNARWIWKQ